MSYDYKFTVFTPTYNRGECLKQLYKKLKQQTYKNFEWLIIDDGSTDHTKDIVDSFILEDKIDIRYFYQKNKGKQKSYNKAVKLASGELFVCIDSDDYYVRDGLKIIIDEWEKICDKSEFAGMGYLSSDKDGCIIGSEFPKDVIDSNHIEIYSCYNVKGDKGLMYRTDILKRYPFPEIKGENFITEAIIYNRIAKNYSCRYINRVIEIKEYKNDGLTNNISQIKTNNPRGYRLYFNEYLQTEALFIDKIKANIWYVIFSKLSNSKDIIKESNSKIISVLIYPIALVYYLFKFKER